jgi:hypothetical protein
MTAPNSLIYLDNNATTRVDPAVLEAMLPYLSELYGNPSSAYRFGKQVDAALETARTQVAGLLGCEPQEIVFTSWEIDLATSIGAFDTKYIFASSLGTGAHVHALYQCNRSNGFAKVITHS